MNLLGKIKVIAEKERNKGIDERIKEIKQKEDLEEEEITDAVLKLKFRKAIGYTGCQGLPGSTLVCR